MPPSLPAPSETAVVGRLVRRRNPRQHSEELGRPAGVAPASSALVPPEDSPATLSDAVEGFLLSRRVGNCTARTVDIYAANLWRFVRAVGGGGLADCTPSVIQRYLTGLRERMRAVSVHQHFRTLRTFLRWCVRTGRLPADSMAGMTMRLPKTLPRVPEDGHVRRLLAACPSTPEGRRNRALIALLADSGLRKEEARRLRIGALDFTARTIHVHAGKGQKDGLAFFGEATSSLLRTWLAVHPDPRPAAFLFVTRDGSPLGPYAIRRILHRLSRRAGLDRLIGPHALRHYAATAIWRRSGDLELVRRVLRHETLIMALRYVAVSQADLAAKFATASPMDHLRAAR
ncbi:MAG: tyrosine-type recombinase/integrase [Armatimonadota bacterium]|nr:tyrosine-type recombinase/integrase [Armatimonadota bacterium]